jgi:transposase
MKPTYDELFAIVKLLSKQAFEYQQTIKRLEKRITALEKQNAELKERLGLDSNNSSKPPSSDQKANKAPPKKGGATLGHKGYARQLIKDPTHVQEHKPKACSICGSAVITLGKPLVFQQWEIPKVSPIITEYRCYGCQCQNCGVKQSPTLPQGVEYSAFGPSLAARIALLTSKFRLSKRQALALIRIDHGIDLSVGSVSNIEGRMTHALEKSYAAIHQAIVNSNETKHIDETGMRQQAKNHFLWVLSTVKAVYLSIQPGRGKKDLQVLLPIDRGSVVTDRYGVYNFSKHQWCWAHLVRNIQKFSERAGIDGEIGKALIFEAKDMLKVYALYREGKLEKENAYQTIYYRRKRIEELLWDAFLEGSETLARFAEKSLDNLKKLWLFAKLRGVEPTNNQAERDLRPLVIWRKTSFGTRSERGSRYIERAMSVIATLERNLKDVVAYFSEVYRSRFDATIGALSPL